MTGLNIAASSMLSDRLVRLAVGAALTAAGLGLSWAAWVYNLERSCTLGQWPGLAICTPADQTVASQTLDLQKRVARNPGDAEAWIRLALLTNQPGSSFAREGDAALETATRLSGQDYRVQRLQAAAALKQARWADAVTWLVRLIQDNNNNDAALALASLLRQPQALAAMQAQVRPGARWLGQLVDALPRAGLPTVVAMPVIVQALQQKAMTPELIQQVIKGLKVNGDWLDAHALWTAWLGRPVDLVFNGSFDQGFLPGGFDWEILPAAQSKAGALVSQVGLAGHGGVLQVEFSGRPLAVLPVIRQHLVLLDRRYVLTGQFMTSKLTSSEGLAWSLHCAAGGREIAHTAALTDTAGQWRSFSLEFEIPPDCGPAVALQLRPFAVYEAATGMRGQAAFDDFRLKSSP